MSRAGTQQFRIEDADHGGAGAGWTDNDFSITEYMQKAFSAGPRFIPKTGIERRLAAAGLVSGKIHFTPNAPQDFYRVHGHLWLQLINKARHEE